MTTLKVKLNEPFASMSTLWNQGTIMWGQGLKPNEFKDKFTSNEILEIQEGYDYMEADYKSYCEESA